MSQPYKWRDGSGQGLWLGRRESPGRSVGVEGRKQPTGIQDKGFQTEGTAEQSPRKWTPVVRLTRAAVAGASAVGAEAGEEMKLEGEKGPRDPWSCGGVRRTGLGLAAVAAAGN